MPYEQGSFNYCLLKRSNLTDFHKEALSLIAHTERLSSLVQDLYYRPQGHAEIVHNFVNNIKESSQILKLNKSELEVTDLEGLLPKFLQI